MSIRRRTSKLFENYQHEGLEQNATNIPNACLWGMLRTIEQLRSGDSQHSRFFAFNNCLETLLYVHSKGGTSGIWVVAAYGGFSKQPAYVGISRSEQTCFKQERRRKSIQPHVRPAAGWSYQLERRRCPASASVARHPLHRSADLREGVLRVTEIHLDRTGLSA